MSMNHHHPDHPDYPTACRIAATDQGLDPVREHLDREFGEGTVTIEQTGGFCMVAYVYSADRKRAIGITDDGQKGHVHYLLVAYDFGRDEMDDGTIIARDVSDLEHVADFVRGFIRVNGNADGLLDRLARCSDCHCYHADPVEGCGCICHGDLAQRESDKRRAELGFDPFEDDALWEERNDEYGASIFETNGSPRYALYWTDYVANDWHEYLPSLELAKLRAATLAYCVETNRWLPNLDAWLALHTAPETGPHTAPEPVLHQTIVQHKDVPGDDVHMEDLRIDNSDARVLDVGTLLDALKDVERNTSVVIATDGWYANIGNVQLPNLRTTPDGAYEGGEYMAVTLFPSCAYDARQEAFPTFTATIDGQEPE